MMISSSYLVAVDAQTSPLAEEPAQSPLTSMISSFLTPAPQKIEIHNRILWSYRRSLITVIDVVKRLDQFWQNDPQGQGKSLQDKFVFYQQTWRAALQELIDNELIYQDAQDHQMQISDAEAKDELIRAFGQHYFTRLAEMGYSFNEALDSAKKDLLTQRMYYYKVQFPSRSVVTPKALAHAYQELVKHYPETDLWRYHVITIKGSLDSAHQAANQLKQHFTNQDRLQIADEVTALKQDFENLKISLSQEIYQSSQQVSQPYLKVLQSLSAKQLSAPIEFTQDSKAPYVRLFYLLEKKHQEKPDFMAIQQQLEEALKNKFISSESQRYVQRLRKQLELEQGQSLQSIFNQSAPLFSLQ